MKNRTLIFLIILAITFIQCNNSAQNITQNRDPQKEEFNVKKLVGNNFDKSREKDISDKFGFRIIDSLTTEFQGMNIKILFESIKDWDDPGDFHRISIVSGTDIKSFFNINGWVQSGAYEKQYIGGNSVEILGSCILTHASDKDLLLITFGYVYASMPGALTIINLSRFYHPALIYNDNVLLYDLTDLNNDGKTDLQVTDKDVEEFNPTSLKKYLLKSGYFSKMD